LLIEILMQVATATNYA